jgi:iron complex outermembrane recepter protein
MQMRHGLIIAALASTALGSPAFGQATTAASTDGMPDIIVTAERRETRLQDTPISITALSAGQIEAKGVRSINDLAAQVPNLTSTTGPQGSADANFFVRGVGQFDFIITNDTGVGVYVDGVFLGRSIGAMLDTADIDRVEVLRGPQGTLFGRNTLGGAISITSVQPKLGDLAVNGRATYGSRNRIDIDGAVNFALGDKAAIRISGVTRNQDGFATNALTGEKFGKTKRDGARATLLFEPTDTLKITLAADYALDKSNPAPSVNLAFAPFPFFPADVNKDRSTDFYTIFASNSPAARNEVYGFSGTLAWDFGGATLKSITAYRNLDSFSTSDPDGTGYRLYDQQTTTQQHQFSQELQLSGDAFDDKLGYLIGAYYFREQAKQVLNLCFAPITPLPTARFNQCNVWSQGNEQKTSSYAVFGQARYNVTDALSLTLGGRYTWEDKDIVSNQFFDFRPAGFSPAPGIVLPGFVAPIVTNLGSSLSFRKFTPKVGLEWKASDDILVFASYAKGFRSGGFNGRLIAPQTFVPTYEPDTNDTYEVGIKSDLIDRTLRLNLTGFYSKYKGIQQTISDPAVQFRVANAGDAELYGFEAELTATPLAGLRFNLGVGYTSSTFQNVPVNVGPINGNRLPFSPEFTVAVGGEYAIDSSVGTFTPRVDYRFQSRTFFTAFNLPLEQQAPYGLLAARLTFVDKSERFSLAVYGDNLTDSKYFTFGQNALQAQGVAYNYIGRPQEFGVTLGVRF